MPTFRFLVISAIPATALLFTALTASATERKFAYSYEVTTAPKGSIEFENTVTWKHYRGEARVDQFDFRHEFEFGVTDRLQIGLYAADWSYTDSAAERGATYDNSGVEVIYNLTNPTTDFLGSALYGEVLVGDRSVLVEGKLLLQKNFGAWTIAYNAVLEAAWEGEHLSQLNEHHGELAQTLGVSYQFTPHFLAGGEVLLEVDLPDWSKAERSIVFAGPNASIRFGRFFATAAGLFRVTSNDGEPNVQTRLIVGFVF